MISCARATRGLRRPSLDARIRGSIRLPLKMKWGIGKTCAVKALNTMREKGHGGSKDKRSTYPEMAYLTPIPLRRCRGSAGEFLQTFSASAFPGEVLQ